MSIPLTGDASFQHLMCPIHSTGRRRPGHPAGGVPVYSHWLTVRLCCHMRSTHHDSRVTEDDAARYQYCMHYGYYGARRSPWGASSSSFLPFVLGPTCQGLVSLYVPPLNYKREGTLRDRFIQTQAILDTTQAHEQYNTQWSRVLRSGGPNHSKPLHVLVCSSLNLVTGKTLRPLLIIGFRAGALCHPAGDFVSNIWRAR
jgi:hypothetical protein